MKNFLVLIVAGSIFFHSCKGQQSKPFAKPEKEPAPLFEEKQKQALQNENPPVPNVITGFNFRYAAGKATPGVVHIKSVISVQARQQVPDLFKDFFGDDFWRLYFPPGTSTPKMTISASGVIVSDDGYIVTNNHVVADADSIEVVLHDQRSYAAKIIGTDPATDIALLKIDEKNLSFIEFGNSDSVQVGDWVLAVGNPFNLASTVTAGIISAKARNINIITDKSAVESYLQTDAAVNRGNSGGALVDINGKLIGINSAISTPTGAYAGYSFAIPVEIVKKTIDDLLRYGKVVRGYLGIIISDMNSQKAKIFGINATTGVVVDSLQKNGAAMQSGIQPKDVIIKIDDHRVETTTQLQEIIARHRPGERIQVTLIRNGMEKIIPATLQASEGTVTHEGNEVLKNLGIEIADVDAKEKSLLKITGGVKVTAIRKGKIGLYTEMKEGFIITKVNSKIVKNTEEFISALQDKKGGIMLEGIYPGVASVYYYAFGL